MPNNVTLSEQNIDSKNINLTVNMRSKSKIYYKGNVKSVTTTNERGEFDILPMHTNFVSIVRKYVTLDKNLPTMQKFDIDSAVLSVQNGIVDIYVGI